MVYASSCEMLYFNSLPHTEVDYQYAQKWANIYLFQLTTSHRGRPVNLTITAIREHNFNSLPHTEVDEAKQDALYVLGHFNSLPHTEVDGIAWKYAR